MKYALIFLCLLFSSTSSATEFQSLYSPTNFPSLTEPSTYPSLCSGPEMLDLDECEKITVWIYTSDSCPYCDLAKRDLSDIPWIELNESKNPPSWVTALPTLHWSDESGGGKKLVGWSSQHRATLISLLKASNPKTSDVIQSELASSAGYPVRGGWWSVNGDWNPSREKVIEHLISDGIHRGKFRRDTLNQMTYAELQSLHSDDHESRVKTTETITVRAATSYCPTGNCPTVRQTRTAGKRRKFFGIF